eukprot:403365965
MTTKQPSKDSNSPLTEPDQNSTVDSLDTKLTHQKTDTLLSKFDLADRVLSAFIHDCVIKPQILEMLVLPFSLAFHPVAVICLIYVIGFLLPKHNIVVGENKVNETGFRDEAEVIMSPNQLMAQYAAQVVCVLILTTITKRYFKRTRPVIPIQSKRMIDLRSKETNCSMPSGDVAQAALFAFFIKYHFVNLFVRLGGDYFILKFVALVSFARVFHHCHFFGDTIVGAMIGFYVAFGFQFLEIIVPLPEYLL